jgi:hypothetical protein
MSDDDDDDDATARRIETKRAQVILDLMDCVDTIAKLSEMLDKIDVLTTGPAACSDTLSVAHNSVLRKLHQLKDELKQWKNCI